MLVLAYDKPEKSIAPPLRHCQTAQELDNPLHRHIRADWHAACVYHVIHMQYLQLCKNMFYMGMLKMDAS
jgi:hypothetical protein